MTDFDDGRAPLWRRKFNALRVFIKQSLPFLFGVAAGLLSLFLFNILNPVPASPTQEQMEASIGNILASATPRAALSADVYKVIQPSLILIQTEIHGKNGRDAQGLGSGVVIDQSGNILTSLHVVAEASDIQLIFPDATQSAAVIVSEFPDKDIAIIRAETPPDVVIPAVIGNPNLMEVGDEAFVVGNPLGLYSSMSSGVISGFNRAFQPTEHNRKLENLIQFDTAVNPGNSGGPLLNRYGEVVGIVTGIVNPTGQDVFIGIGFAMPIDLAGGAAGLPPY